MPGGAITHITQWQRLSSSVTVICTSRLTLQQSSLGEGSQDQPFRVHDCGVTCTKFVEDYVSVQRRVECTSIVHLDSTHGMVIHSYLACAIGCSDNCGRFPLVYFCTSQRKSLNVGWCLRYLKRLCRDVCCVDLEPQYVTADAHLAGNVLVPCDTEQHAPSQEKGCFERTHYKTQKLAHWQALPQGPLHSLTQHIIRMWINSIRFARWQAFVTPPGCATTNNPLEQDHGRLKRECRGGGETPAQLVENLNNAFLAFINRGIVFSHFPEASERLVSLDQLLYNRGCLSVEYLPRVSSLAADILPRQSNFTETYSHQKKERIIVNSFR
ncbi:hypothetical protein P3T76_011679 [Phytophthora citrophthora]|uniref:Uncharacterized protein n=1 Tax=Phytophthora citrophthora TaxID=4793 RepID=A0AAD9G8M1_9STRA|nr:hypothetical protein P3T76_011679 [Phytophthora citrophthora]